MVIWAPLALERSVEGVHFSDQLGTFPVEVTLCHDGRSTLDTGLFGEVYWAQTGRFGFGARARATGPPEAGGTLASYVDRDFINANVALINDPDAVVSAYSARFAQTLRARVLLEELAAALLGGTLLFIVVPRRRRGRPGATAELVVAVLLVGAATGVSAAVAARLFDDWSCNQPVSRGYAMPGVKGLSFSSPETLEVARQVKPFVRKNTERIAQKAERFEVTAQESFADALARQAADLAPREGETIVAAEADPQGSFVATRLRSSIYRELVETLGADAISVRTISGDVSSNGTVAESGFISDEAKVSGEIPTVAVAGDHDSEVTWKQMAASGIKLPDLETIDVAGLRFSGANDREHKSLFGGEITNDSGISEEELGAQLREKVDDKPRIVLLHQPDAAAGYFGLPSLTQVRSLEGGGRLTVPYDDGIPDVPPGVVNIGHLHATNGPWVLWNNDADEVTWTLVDQLGTSGGVENRPTFNRFSTPVSAPLKPVTIRLQYVHVDSGLATGFATISIAVNGECTIIDRVDVGLPGGQPRELRAARR